MEIKCFIKTPNGFMENIQLILFLRRVDFVALAIEKIVNVTISIFRPGNK